MPSKPLPPAAVSVVPATPELWADIQALFEQTPCWCQAWRVSASDYGRVSKELLLTRVLAQRRAALRQQLDQPTPPGILAYVDGESAGWCGLGPRRELVRLARSRTIPAVDDLPVWAIVCFLVRTGYRRRGVARALLEGAIATARQHGAPALEAYPVEPGVKRISTNFAYVGTVPMFEKAGFQRILETEARSAGLPRWLMRLEL